MIYLIIVGLIAIAAITTFGRYRLEKENLLELEELQKSQSDSEWKVEQIESRYKLYNTRTEKYISHVFDVYDDNERIDHATTYGSELSARRSLKRYLIRKTKGKLL